MKFIINCAKYLIMLVLISAVCSIIFVNFSTKKFAGGHTSVVDRTQFKVNSGAILLHNISTLSADGKTMIDNQSVLLENGKIKKIASSINEGELPSNTAHIDGTNRYLIPSLMDGHMHLSQRENDLLLYFANGITHVRDMGGTKFMIEMREKEKNGSVGPDMYIASQKIYGDRGLKGMFSQWTRTRINIASEGKADKVAKKLALDGFDAIKIGGHTTDEVHKALLQAGQKYEIDIVGHLHISTGLDGLWEGGQIELAHIEEITKALFRDFGGMSGDNTQEALAYVRGHADDIAVKLRENNIAVTSSIWLMESLPKQKFDLENALTRVNLRYADPGSLEGTRLAKGWLPGHNSYQLSDKTENDPKRKADSRAFWDAYVEAIHIMTKALVRNNVIIIAGTDAGTPIVVPGFSLHDELISLKDAGLTNAQALRAATSVPSDWLKENTGKITPGYRANLLILDDNPLIDIANTKHIFAVIKDGNYYNRQKLDAMLEAVIIAHDKARTKDITAFEQ